MKLASARIFLALFALPALSCRNLDRFDTGEKGAFCGDLVSGPSFHDGFVPDLSPALLRVGMTLDTSKLSTYSEDKATRPAFLTSNDRASGLCAEYDQALFENAPLRSIPQVDHDSIASMSFGEGHDTDFFAYVDSTCQGTMLAVVSLLRKGDVELRLFKPAPLPSEDADAAHRPGFALFYLHKNEEGCGF
ncbi:MAG: hypothetical protein K0R38_2459 [Polyangiaceae bacterium]|jgi:hypothetical protein|nr:hypothetical protein [Polyangiaceae bacterium]